MQFERCAPILWRHTYGSVVLLDPDDADPVTMDGLGALAWLALDRPSTEHEVWSALTDVVGPGESVEPTDVRVALDELVGRGFVRRVTS